ncbi:hypothetical protein SSX86_006613 [Deinandra increscens subsp. villosa]|uniref:MULE transposase domain-containing protein n=1 Tax=Deinandra increscens subsp. villosa TaxID=3103831 RepID=A0AAP0DN25_9ASTR
MNNENDDRLLLRQALSQKYVDDIYGIDEQFEGGCSVIGGQQIDDVLNHRSSSGCKLIEYQPNVVEANFVHLEDGNEVDGEGVNADYDDDGNEVDGNEVDGNEVVNHDDVDGNEDEDEQGYNEDDDGDYIVEEDNGMDDYDVDMRDYKIYVDSDVDELLDDDEDIEDEVVDSESFLQPRRGLEEGNNLFYRGQLFGTKEECKELIRAHAVETRRDIRIIKDEDERVRAVCKGGRGKKTNPHQFQCPWVLLLSKVGEKDSWCIRTLLLQHKCQPVRKSYACTSTYLFTKLVHQVAKNPEIPVKAIQDQFQRELQLRISKMQAFRAKVKAKKEVHGDYISQFAYLRDYVNELRSKNPGTTVKIEVEGVDNPDLTTRKFKRIYICLGALKNGFKAIGRDLLGLDGAFMKGPFPGQILSAVGIDPNNNIYPVCYAIVEAENLSSWTWFLECLGEDLDLDVRSNFTFVSDRQKGLLPAMANVFPSAEHRYCLRHIHENFKGTFKGKEYKDMLWKAATSTTVVHFKREMDVLKEFNTDAHEWL